MRSPRSASTADNVLCAYVLLTWACCQWIAPARHARSPTRCCCAPCLRVCAYVFASLFACVRIFARGPACVSVLDVCRNGACMRVVVCLRVWCFVLWWSCSASSPWACFTVLFFRVAFDTNGSTRTAQPAGASGAWKPRVCTCTSVGVCILRSCVRALSVMGLGVLRKLMLTGCLLVRV